MTGEPTVPEDGPAGFEESMETVESIIESIESGELGLEESIRAYEKAAGLLRGCREELRAAELRVEKISDLLSEDGDSADTSKDEGEDG